MKTLEAHGVTHLFGTSGAKVDRVFIALLDSPIELVLCRHLVHLHGHQHHGVQPERFQLQPVHP